MELTGRGVSLGWVMEALVVLWVLLVQPGIEREMVHFPPAPPPPGLDAAYDTKEHGMHTAV